jgi:hypothetical protein
MRILRWNLAVWLGIGSSLLITSCGGGSSNTTPPVTKYTLSIGSTNPASGVSVSVNPADNTGATSGTTPFTLTYNANTTVVINAPATAGSNQFSSWTGCTSTTASCTTAMYGDTAITANYVPHGVAINPNPATAAIGGTIQFSATVNGAISSTMNWSVAAPSGSNLSPGTITATGLYTTPYPAPPTVTVTATDPVDTTQSASVTVTITAPAAAAGPALSVDAGNQTRPINPYIYGWNGYSADASASQAANITVDRWGGDATSLYNYKLDVSNAGSDWYFENGVSGTEVPASQDASAFNTQVEADAAAGAKTLGTVGLMGWVAKDGTSCSFPTSLYPSQFAYNPFNHACGDGELPDQSMILGSPANAETPVDPTWATGWVAYLAGKFGTASNGGVAIYSLDNEPDWWDGGHHDVYTHPFSYDDITNLGLTYAAAIKASDPTAEVAGPVMSFWWDFFYSKKDVEAGWDAGGNCSQPWSNPVDRAAHGGIPMIEYYLQKFAAYDKTNSQRLLDYLDLHTYFAATYNGNGLGLTTAGDTGAQQARLNSTRVFWDPTYTDPNYPQPNYTTDTNYTTNCNVPLLAPQMIPMAQGWIAKDYPNTKLAFTEYNWGGQEHINGALAQADLLGIFGKYGLDMATLWGPPDPTTQIPGLMAYEVFRNYDGKNSKFGNTALASTSINQGQLSVYGAWRSSDNAVTVVVINKTYGDLTSTLSLANLVSGTATAHPFLYSNANLAAIVPQTTVTIIPPAAGGTISTISNYTFPAQSITLFVVLQ